MILIIYTVSLGVNKETKKSIKVGAVKVYDTNLIYSRVIGLQASDRPVDIVDLLAHELARVPSPLFTDSGELRTASAKSVLKTNTAQLLSARRAQENVDVIVIDGSAYLWISSWPASGTIQHYIEKFKYHIGQMYSLHLTDTKSTALGGTGMMHHLTTATILSSQKVVLTVTENKKQLINIICEELQNDKDFIDSFSHEHTLLITGEGDPPWQLSREQNAYLSWLMTLMSIFCCYIITIRKSSTFQCSWNPLFTKDKL